MITVILNLIGIAVFYIVRYKNRTVKNAFDFHFWVKENILELGATLLVNVGLMILLLHPATDPTEYINSIMPDGLIIAVKPFIGGILGVYLSNHIYIWINKKIA